MKLLHVLRGRSLGAAVEAVEAGGRTALMLAAAAGHAAACEALFHQVRLAWDLTQPVSTFALNITLRGFRLTSQLTLRPSIVCLEWQISSTFLVPRPLLKPYSTCQIAKTEAKFGRILPLF
jgi:hypothetical protein